MPSVPLLNFSKGEIAPDLYGRIETPQYNAGLKTGLNFIVLKYGGATFRPGTRFVGAVDDPEEAQRLIPFRFSFEQSYVLMMQQGVMRPIAAGGFVIEQNTQITAIVRGVTTTLTIPLHGYSVGDKLYFSGVEGMTELNGMFAWVVSVADPDTIVVDLDSSGFSAFVSSDGTLNAGPPPTPPAPPVVPPPVVPPTPPSTTPGGGIDYDWRYGYYPPWYIPPEL